VGAAEWVKQGQSWDIHHLYTSWAHGAFLLSEWLVDDLDVAKRAWGKGDAQRAIALIEVCIQPMITIWCRDFYAQAGHDFSDEERQENKEVIMSNVMYMLGTVSNTKAGEGKLKRFLNLDAQWNYQEDRREEREKQGDNGISLWYVTLLASMVQRALGYKGFINWRQQAFPVTQHRDFCFKDKNRPFGAWGRDWLSCITQLDLAILGVATRMFDCFHSRSR